MKKPTLGTNAALSDAFWVNTVVVVRVLTQKVHSRQLELLFAVVTSLLVEGARRLLHADNFLFHLVNVFHVLIYLIVVLLNAIYLCLQLCQQEVLQDFKSQHVRLSRCFLYLESTHVILTVRLD